MFIDKKNQNKYLEKNPLFFINLLVIMSCLTLFLVFPSRGGLQEIIKGLFFMILIPALYIKIVLKGNLADFGLNFQNKKSGIIWSILVFLLLSATFVFFVRNTDFLKHYAMPTSAMDSFWYFLFYQLVFVNIFLIIYEFFFRGFILFSLSPKMRYWAIGTQAMIFLGSLVVTKNFNWQMAPAMAIALTSGIVAYKSRSIFFSYLTSLLFLILLDAYILSLLK